MTSFTPQNPDFERKTRASFAAQGLMTTLGARLAEVLPGRVVIEVPFAKGLDQQQGLFHGGVIGAIGDTAGGYASYTLMDAGSEVLTVEYKINFVRPAKGALLRAEGQVLRSGRTLSVARIDVSVIEEGRASAAALIQGTFMRVAPFAG